MVRSRTIRLYAEVVHTQVIMMGVLLVSVSTGSTQNLPVCIGDSRTWSSSHGQSCYQFDALINCNNFVDPANSSLTASLICHQCGQCSSQPRLCSGNRDDWLVQTGYNCEDFNRTLSPYTYRNCNFHRDSSSNLTANEVCSECGDCTNPPPPTAPPPPTTPPPTIWGSNQASPNPYHGTADESLRTDNFVPNQTTCMDIWETSWVGGLISWNFGYNAAYTACVHEDTIGNNYNLYGTFNINRGFLWYPSQNFPRLRSGECPIFALPNSCYLYDDAGNRAWCSKFNVTCTCVRFSVTVPSYTTCEEYKSHKNRHLPPNVTLEWEDLCDPNNREFSLKPMGRVVQDTGFGNNRRYSPREFCQQCRSTSHGGCFPGYYFRPNPNHQPTQPPTRVPTPPPTPPLPPSTATPTLAPTEPTPAPTYTLPPTQVERITVLQREATVSDVLVEDRTLTTTFDISFSSITNVTEFVQDYINALKAPVSMLGNNEVNFRYENVQVFPVSQSSRRRDNHDDITGTMLLVDNRDDLHELQLRVELGAVEVQNSFAVDHTITATAAPTPPPVNDDETGDGDGGDSSNTAVIAGAAGGGGALLFVVGLLVYYRKEIFTTRGRLGGTGSGTGYEALEGLM